MSEGSEIKKHTGKENNKMMKPAKNAMVKDPDGNVVEFVEKS
ncbi:MAG: hypothetical protein P4L38_11845 [Syntrophaceae bacterium]|nr:hypothetical protein [Syntrophaceae bacterium]